MKREIKFRGRNYDGMWMYGYLMPAPKPTIHLDCDYSISVSPSALKSVDRMLYEVETNTVGQYTGLKDKNDREIYEHDLIEVRGIISEVVYNDKLGAYTLFELKTHNLGRKALGVMMADFPDMIVIGNIHEDKHLLK